LALLTSLVQQVTERCFIDGVRWCYESTHLVCLNWMGHFGLFCSFRFYTFNNYCCSVLFGVVLVQVTHFINFGFITVL